MDYSLLSKFRGAWLGSIIAAQMKEKAIATRQQDDLSSSIRNQPKSTYLADDKLLELVKQQWRSLATHWNCDSKIETLEPELANPKATIYSIAANSLPIILYYHDYWSYLARFLVSQGEKHQLAPTSIDTLLIWAFTVRLGLRGELNKQNLTHQILSEANITASFSQELLSQINYLCLKGFNSQKLLQNHVDNSSLTMGLSLFYVLNNINEFSLGTQQGIELENSQQLEIATLGGALSGAYNGLSSIPSSWRNYCQEKDYYQYVISKTEDIMGRWLGSEFIKETKLSPNIVTSVGILQPRKNLKIISQ